MLLLNGQNGGGQILRTALSLSAITGQPFHLKNIRGKRPKPGLMRQHLTCVRAMTELCDAATDGAELNSRELIFHPGPIRPGNYQFAIGTAGSTTLLAQTLLPALWSCGQTSTLHLEGGTHNPMAPPFEFIRDCFLPAVEQIGFRASAELQQVGYAPAGGGKLQISVHPSTNLKSAHFLERGPEQSRTTNCLISHISRSVAERELDALSTELEGAPFQRTITEDSTAACAGNALSATVEFANITERITAFGKPGRSGNAVAKEVAKKMNQYLTSGAVVGRHLADQLLLPMALVGRGSFLITDRTNHLETNAHVIQTFLPEVNIAATQEDSATKVTITKT